MAKPFAHGFPKNAMPWMQLSIKLYKFCLSYDQIAVIGLELPVKERHRTAFEHIRLKIRANRTEPSEAMEYETRSMETQWLKWQIWYVNLWHFYPHGMYNTKKSHTNWMEPIRTHPNLGAVCFPLVFSFLFSYVCVFRWMSERAFVVSKMFKLSFIGKNLVAK